MYHSTETSIFKKSVPVIGLYMCNLNHDVEQTSEILPVTTKYTYIYFKVIFWEKVT